MPDIIGNVSFYAGDIGHDRVGAEVRQVIFHKGECHFGRCAEYNNVRVFQVTDIDGIHYALPKGGLCRR